MGPALLELILDSSVIIDAERKGQTVEDLLEQIRQSAVGLGMVLGMAAVWAYKCLTRAASFISGHLPG
jgi:uncharacterized membrane protein (Fun14 family)